MHSTSGEIYHVYNRGNNKQLIFFNEDHYLFFLKKPHVQLTPVCEILCWCLMPNHFHLLIQANTLSCEERPGYGGKPMQELSYRIGKLLSSYTQAINKQSERTGSLFQQKTKSKSISEIKLANGNNQTNYLQKVVRYIHRNPLNAKLVKKPEDWLYSSFRDYAGLRNGILCKKDLLLNLIDIEEKQFLDIGGQ